MALKTRNVFMTGGAQGLGKCFTDYLLKAGARVVFGDINAHAGKATETEFSGKYGSENVLFQKLDVTDQKNFEEAFQAAVKKLGNVDLMVNNAGIMNESVWELMTNINFNGVVRGTYIAMEHMRKDKGGKGGRIVNINSEMGLDHSFISPVYCATKHSTRAFTKCLAISPAVPAMGIEFGLLCPGATRTNLTEQISVEKLPNLAILEGLEPPALAPVELIAEAFMELINYEELNDAMLRVDLEEKQHYKIEKIKRTWPPSPEEKSMATSYKS